MSLFPAYASEDGNQILTEDSSVEIRYEGPELTETQLLASDDEAAPPARPRPRPASPADFYLDTKFDPGNLWVSTLYYPGRPQYSQRQRADSVTRQKRRARRYFEVRPEDADEAAEVAARAAAYRRALADQPRDERLWDQFIQFQERCSGGEAALRAAEEACAAAPAARGLRTRRLQLAARHLPPDRHLAELRDLIAAAKSPAVKLELWVRLLTALAGAGSCSASLAAATCAALRELRAPASAYPRLLYVYGAFLRSAGLWEQLTLLLELALGMSLPPSTVFPPPADPRALEAEETLLVTEERAVNSGMPLSSVWVRVERARAAAHWRADARAAAASADPQRAPAAADLADLLLPVAEPRALALLLVQALRLAKVPLLPAAGWVARAADGPAAAALAGAGWAAGGGEALLAPLRAARRLPPAHAARRVDARALAHYLQPPHYCNDTGFLAWVEALWEAALGWSTGRQREALLCWRLRWMHSLVIVLDPKDEAQAAEQRRLVKAARGCARRHGGGAAAGLQLARLQRAAGLAPQAARLALATLRTLLHDQSAEEGLRLYGARVAGELGGAAAGRWALCCAALGAALPADAALCTEPPPDLLVRAANTCEQRCSEIESSFNDSEEGEEVEEDACAALLPSCAEWACARALLASHERRALLLRALLAGGGAGGGGAGGRWREQAACALAVAAAGDARAAETARDLAPLFPDNSFLALAAESGAVWAPAAAPRGDAAALVRALPALLAAPPPDWTPQEAERVYRSVSRACAGGGGGALLLAARLAAAARRPRPDPARVLYQALHAAPHSKWLHVAGAAACGEARGPADALLERQLRLHALPDELQPLAPPPPSLRPVEQ